MKSSSKNGKINLILGCMFSGKTSTLISRYNRYTIGGKRCVMIKYKGDTRYDKKRIVTHDNIKVDAFVCEYLFQIDEKIIDYDVICVDEVQFYRDAPIFCEKWANSGKIVEACGLNGNFERKPFEVISRLLPLVEDITFLSAVCRDNGLDAHFSKRLIDNSDEEVIGGEDIYTANDRSTFDHRNQEIENFKEFINIYNETNNIRTSNFMLKKFVKRFSSLENRDRLSYLDILISCYKMYDTTGRFLKKVDN